MQMHLRAFLVFSSFSARLMTMAPEAIELIEHAKSKSHHEMDLSRKGIDDVLLEKIIKHLIKHERLSRLNLSFNEITDAGVMSLVELLRRNYEIRQLYLENNDLIFSNHDREQIEDLRITLLRNKKLFKILKDLPKISAMQLSLYRNLPGDMVSFVLLKYFQAMLEEDLKHNLLGKFVSIPGDSYVVGPSPFKNAEQSQGRHSVILESFSIMEKPVTQECFARKTGKNPSFHSTKAYCPLSYKIIKVGTKAIEVCADFPVESLSQKLIKEFFAAINHDPKYGYRLPKGIELEILGAHDAMALYKDLYPLHSARTHPVKYGPKNKFGIYPSSVAEWAQPEYETFSGGQRDAEAFFVAFGEREKIARRFVIDLRTPDHFLGLRIVRFEKNPKLKSYAKKIKKKKSEVKSRVKQLVNR